MLRPPESAPPPTGQAVAPPSLRIPPIMGEENDAGPHYRPLARPGLRRGRQHGSREHRRRTGRPAEGAGPASTGRHVVRGLLRTAGEPRFVPASEETEPKPARHAGSAVDFPRVRASARLAGADVRPVRLANETAAPASLRRGARSGASRARVPRSASAAGSIRLACDTPSAWRLTAIGERVKASALSLPHLVRLGFSR